MCGITIYRIPVMRPFSFFTMNKTKRFSIRYKLIIIFGLLIAIASSIEGFLVQMRKLDDLTRLITDSMNEIAAGALQINNAVQEVNEITQKNKMSIDSLTDEVKKFKERK